VCKRIKLLKEGEQSLSIITMRAPKALAVPAYPFGASPSLPTAQDPIVPPQAFPSPATAQDPLSAP